MYQSLPVRSNALGDHLGFRDDKGESLKGFDSAFAWRLFSGEHDVLDALHDLPLVLTGFNWIDIAE